ncbi:MAG TPA: serine/threonine-protein kinase, partial [Gemmataceae bacterium]|nr:serine/threonine-protein kinase [Gemmataceae bacterium]
MSEPASTTPSGPGPRRGPGEPLSPPTRPPSEWTHGTLAELAAPSFPGPAPAPAFPGYEVVRELGHGGMGVVYLARDVKHGRPVALKTVQWLDPAALYRFKQEFRCLADRAHPNLVTLYELYADARLCFFTMELLDGAHFLAHVRGSAAPPDEADYRLPPEGVARLRAALRQLGDGLAALHRANVLHRDVKPANVLVTREGRVVLLDFGLATAELDAAGLHQSVQPRLLGTAAYMAPEQAAGKPVSASSDWYAVGVMLYEALTGRLPFRGSLTEVLLDKQQHDPPRPRDLVPDVPDDLDALCVDLLRRAPEERPPGAEVLRQLGAEAGPASPAAVASAAGAEGPLVGRQRHLRALTDAFEAVRQGRAVTVCVHGRSGVGKSALLRCFLHGLSESGRAVVLAGRCYEQESVPYKALDSVIDALSRYLERLPPLEAQALLPRDMGPLTRVFPVLGRVEAVASAPGRAPDSSDPKEVRRRGLAALREMLARLADRRPLVLAIDDLQWGDVDSAALLGDLLRPPDTPALLLVASYRSEDAATSPCLRHLLRAGAETDRRELAVEPLSPEEGEELALALLPGEAADRAVAAAIAREARGNPFFLHELAQHAQAGPLPAHGADTGVSLQEVLWARVLGLPEGDRRLLEVVAVASQPLREADACAAAEVGAEGPQALARLRAARFLRTAGPAEREEVETYHDRIRETVTGRLAPA